MKKTREFHDNKSEYISGDIIFSPRYGAYSRAALIRVNTVIAQIVRTLFRAIGATRAIGAIIWKRGLRDGCNN